MDKKPDDTELSFEAITALGQLGLSTAEAAEAISQVEVPAELIDAINVAMKLRDKTSGTHHRAE